MTSASRGSDADPDLVSDVSAAVASPGQLDGADGEVPELPEHVRGVSAVAVLVIRIGVSDEIIGIGELVAIGVGIPIPRLTYIPSFNSCAILFAMPYLSRGMKV